MKKQLLKISALLLSAVILLTSCGTQGGVFDTKLGDVRKTFNDDFVINEVELTGGDIPDDFSAFYEAENGELNGCTVKGRASASGGGVVAGLDSEEDTLTFKVSVPYDGMYDLVFAYFSTDANRVNKLIVDGNEQGEIKCNIANAIDDYCNRNIYLSAGEHDITVGVSWGWVEFDCLTVVKSTSVTADTYDVTCSLSNPNADDNTKRLYNFLCDIYGNYSLTGQYADDGRLADEYTYILETTGKEFAVLGLDMMNYTLVNKSNGAVGNSMERAHDWYHNAGGIVQYCWHWNSPKSYVASGSSWWNSFYSENSDIDLDKIMNGEDERGYELLMKDIDNIATELQKLRDDGVPILWRPLHEAAGGWFWWGDCEPESYIKLWRVMYDKMTNEFNLTNLIWVWNGQDLDWYPGDDVVDIVSWDIYADRYEYGSYSSTFALLTESYGETKLIALSENGIVMDPELCFRDNARWLFWGTWSGEYASGIYTSDEMLYRAYNSEYTLTLDELPNLKEYRLD